MFLKLRNKGQDLAFVYCDPTNGWQLNTKDKNPIEFKPKHDIIYGEIFGGLVDNDRRIAYLFQAERSASNEYVRKWFHECYYHFKVSLNLMKSLNNLY